MKTVFSRTCEVEVEIRVSSTAPEDTIRRGLTEEWQRSFSTFDTEDQVLEHLAYNCISNGVEDASRLDGWADLDSGMLTMSVESVSMW